MDLRPLTFLTCRAEQVVAECPAKAGNGVRRVADQTEVEAAEIRKDRFEKQPGVAQVGFK